MGLNDAVSAERIHIGFFGLRNAGKSSVVNAVTGQTVSLVSDVKGTTTDPVKKTMELLPLGPVVIIDTPGTDDEGALGELRVKRAKQTLNYTDIAVLVVDASKGIQPADDELLTLIKNKNIPYVIVFNKSDLLSFVPQTENNKIYVSAEKKTNINELKELIAVEIKDAQDEKRIVADLILPEDLVLLVVPIDESAPKGRLILPQQQVIREVLECGATAIMCRDTEVAQTLSSLNKNPKIVITDSQVFGKVSSQIHDDIPLTSFSILFVRYKGDLTSAVRGAAQLAKLKDGDRVLISEGCTHHRQCNDIGTVKLPNWIKKYSDKKIEFDFTSGNDFPDDLSAYSLVVHCGACMLNKREMQYRARHACDSGVPMTNYGVAIAQMHGILERSIKLFPDALKELK